MKLNFRNLTVSALAILAIAALAPQAQAGIIIGASTKAFVDISVTGTSVGAISDDSEFTVTGASLAGWAGNELLGAGRSIRVGNNGGVIWGNSATDTFTNATDVGAINASSFGTSPNPFLTMTPGNSSFSTPTGNGGLGPRQFLAVLWDDNSPGASPNTGSTKWQVMGNGDLVVQWTNEDHFNASGAGVITYEMIAHPGVTIASGASLVDYVYQDTQYAANQFQNDGGSATIGYKNWNLVQQLNANDVEFGLGGGNNSLSDPALLTDPSHQSKVAGYIASDNPNLPHAVCIGGVGGVCPEPTTLSLLGLGVLGLIRRRR